MRIAIINPPFIESPPRSYGGVEVVTWNLSNSLIAKGHQVVVFGCKGSQMPKGGFLVEYNEVAPIQSDWRVEEGKMFKKIRDILVKGDFDIIHDHTWTGWVYTLKKDYPYLQICHTHHGGLNWVNNPPNLNNLDMNLFAISKWMKFAYGQLGWDSRVVYNGVDVSDYSLHEEKGDRLLFVGRLDEFKQPHVAIEVARKAGLEIDVVGSSFVQNQNYMQKVIGMCKEKAVLHLDAPNEVKIDMLKKAKAVIIPSRMGEPFNLVAIEAMACGTPVISTKDGALPEVVGDKGYTCNNVEEMAEALKKPFPTPKELRVYVEQNFTREVMASNYEKEYKRMVDGTN